MDYIERNYNILEKSMIETMEKSLDLGRRLIDSELDAGFLNFIVKPIVKTFYKFWSNTDAKEGTLQQIKATLETAKRLRNGCTEEKFNQVIEENFHEYLSGDQTSRNCKKSHKNYQELVRITKEGFVTQVKESILYLNVDKEDVECYDDLTKEVFSTKEQAYKALKRQLDLNEAGIKIVEKDLDILTVPTGKQIIVKVLRKGFDQTKKELIASLDNIYN